MENWGKKTDRFPKTQVVLCIIDVHRPWFNLDFNERLSGILKRRFELICLNIVCKKKKNSKDKWRAFRGKAHSVAHSASSLFRLKSPFLCQVLKCPCHIKWQISGHLTFLPTPSADAVFLMTLSASCQVSWGLMRGKSPVEGRRRGNVLKGGTGALRGSDFSASVSESGLKHAAQHCTLKL